METELSFGQTTFLLWVPPFLSYELWKLRIELWELAIQTVPKWSLKHFVFWVFWVGSLLSKSYSYFVRGGGPFVCICCFHNNILPFIKKKKTIYIWIYLPIYKTSQYFFKFRFMNLYAKTLGTKWEIEWHT